METAPNRQMAAAKHLRQNSEDLPFSRLYDEMAPIIDKMHITAQTAQPTGQTMLRPTEPIKPVSYTHLDVYKRQASIMAAEAESTEEYLREGGGTCCSASNLR